MITALCMNPCLDRTVTVEGFEYGGMNRVSTSHSLGAGKGVNLALAGAGAGIRTACIGILASRGSEAVTRRLTGGGVPWEFVPVPGELRVNMKLWDGACITEINEAGDPIGPDTVEAALELCLRWAGRSRAMILTGSLPPGCPDDFYARAITRLREHCPGFAVAVDAEGPRLAHAVEARPWLIKPNRYELELLAGHSLPTPEDVARECAHLVEAGVEHVLVSLGGDGALIMSREGCWYAPAIPCPVADTVGAGDSMLCVAADALCRGAGPEGALADAVAMAAAAVSTPGPGADGSRFADFRGQASVRKMG